MENQKPNGLRTLVIGSGNFGTSLAHHLGQKGVPVDIWARSDLVSLGINQDRKNPNYLKDILLSANLTAISGYEVLQNNHYEFYIIALPTQHIRTVLTRFAPYIPTGAKVVCASKGIEVQSLQMPISIVKETLPQISEDNIAVLSGPSFAIEVARGHPTSVSVGSSNPATANATQELFHSTNFRTYTCSDPIGLEVAGAMKNVVALASGASRGMGLEHNAWAALLTRGLAEITRFGLALGANPITFIGLGGVGDLFLTCTSEKSRNYRVGLMVGQGLPVEEALAQLDSIAEGVTTAKSAFHLSQKLNLDTPITKGVYEVLHEKKPLQHAVAELFAREKKAEVTYP